MKRLPIAAAAAAAAVLALAPAAHAGDGLGAAALLPADTTAVVNINFKRLRRSSSYADILAAAQANDSYKKGAADLKKAGIDVEKDVDTLVLGARASAAGSGDGFVLVVEGRFSPPRLVKVLRKRNADMKTKQHHGVKYYDLESGSIAILGRRVIIAETARMPSVIDLFKGNGKAITKRHSFKKLSSKIDTKKDVWFVVEIPKAQRAGMGMAGIENIEALSGSLDLRSGLGVRVRVTATDAANAAQMSAMVKMGLSMAESSDDAKKMGLDAIVKKTVVITDERDTVMQVDLTKAEAASLKAVAEMAGGAM